MLLGPVFNAELMMTARRARYYVVRFLYGGIILFTVYTTYESNAWYYRATGEMQLAQMAGFALSMFASFAILQLVVVILLTPALVAGAIADERQRKTLHYLLTSQLSGGEIVLGKLAARLIHVVVLVALGLPVVSLLGLFGGIDYQLLFMSYGGTLTTIYFLAGMSILVSVNSRRPREAIALVYVLTLFWALGPPILIELLRSGPEPWPTIGSWVNPSIEYVALTSPLYLTFAGSRAFGPNTLWINALWMMGLQVAYGTAFVALAAFRLRRAFRDEGGESRLGRFIAGVKRKRRWLPRPECGDDPMMWKEKYVARLGGVTKGLVIFGGFVVGAIVAYSVSDEIFLAWDELSREGYGSFGNHRRNVNVTLRITCSLIYVLWMLGIASATAGGVTSEREEDQWLSLTSTPLDGREILRAKMFGPIWGFKPVVFVLVGLWGLGVFLGSVHPVGFLASAIELTVFTWFLAALGTFFSLRSKNSMRSLASTIALLIFLNGGYLFCCIPLRPNTNMILAFSTPVLMGMVLAPVEDIRSLLSGNDRWMNEGMLANVVGVVSYGLAAAGLTAYLFNAFDRVVDRPDRARQPTSKGQFAAKTDGRKKPSGRADDLG